MCIRVLPLATLIATRFSRSRFGPWFGWFSRVGHSGSGTVSKLGRANRVPGIDRCRVPTAWVLGLGFHTLKDAGMAEQMADYVVLAPGHLDDAIEHGFSMDAISGEPFQFLYISALGEGFSAKSVSAIASLSRRENLRNSISGALLFDGQRFVQLLEGGEAQVLSLVTRIRADLRHYSVSVLSTGHYGLPRLTSHWCLGRATLRCWTTFMCNLARLTRSRLRCSCRHWLWRRSNSISGGGRGSFRCVEEGRSASRRAAVFATRQCSDPQRPRKKPTDHST